MKALLLILLLPFFLDTGNTFPTAAANVDRGFMAWSNVTNIFADDGSIASVVTFDQADYLVATGFGFSIPAGATILGVTVRTEAYSDFGPHPNLRAQLQDNSSTLVGSEKFVNMTGGAAYTIYTHGSGSDLWGATLTPAIVNDSDFGVRVYVASISDVRIDFITVSVTYRNRRIFNTN